MKKQIVIYFFLLTVIQPIFCNDSISGKIIFYREANYVGSAIPYPIMLNDSLVVKLKNNSYFIHQCAPGSYNLQLKNLNSLNFNFDVEENKTYYVRFISTPDAFSYVAEAILVDSTFASSALQSGKIRDMNNLTQIIRPKRRLGFNVEMGAGFDRAPMITMDNGKDSKFSFGGGYGVGLRYGYELTPHFDLAVDLNYQYSELLPTLQNASMDFSRGILSLTPSYIIPIKGGETMRLKLGAGVDAYFGNTLDINCSELSDGAKDDFSYNSAFGFHLSSFFEVNCSDNWSYTYGIKWYSVKYTFSEARYYGSSDNFLIKPSGSGLDFIMGLSYHF